MQPRVLDGDGAQVVHALLLESDAVEVSLAVETGARGLAELLAGVVDALVLTHELALVGLAGVALVEKPGAVNGPVTEVTVAGHAERRGRKTVQVATEDLNAAAVLTAGGRVLGLALLLRGFRRGRCRGREGARHKWEPCCDGRHPRRSGKEAAQGR